MRTPRNQVRVSIDVAKCIRALAYLLLTLHHIGML